MDCVLHGVFHGVLRSLFHGVLRSVFHGVLRSVLHVEGVSNSVVSTVWLTRLGCGRAQALAR